MKLPFKEGVEMPIFYNLSPYPVTNDCRPTTGVHDIVEYPSISYNMYMLVGLTPAMGVVVNLRVQ